MSKPNLLPSLGEGFRVIVRYPLSVLVWGLITFAAAFLPLLAYWALVGPEMVKFYGDMARVTETGTGQMPMPPGITGAGASIQALQFVLAPVSGAVVFAGVYRAVLRPEEGGFGHVRFTGAEFRVGVALVVMYVFMMVVAFLAMIVMFIPLFIGIAFAAASGAAIATGIIFLVAFIALPVALAWLFSRFGMAVPMSFAEGQIRIFEGWSFTKGYGGQLLGMALIQLAMVAAISIALWIAVIAGVFGLFTEFGQSFDSASLEALFQDSDALLQRFLPFIAVGGILYVLLTMVLQPILLAPWARAYQLIAAEKLAARAETFT